MKYITTTVAAAVRRLIGFFLVLALLTPGRLALADPAFEDFGRAQNQQVADFEIDGLEGFGEFAPSARARISRSAAAAKEDSDEAAQTDSTSSSSSSTSSSSSGSSSGSSSSSGVTPTQSTSTSAGGSSTSSTAAPASSSSTSSSGGGSSGAGGGSGGGSSSAQSDISFLDQMLGGVVSQILGSLLGGGGGGEIFGGGGGGGIFGGGSGGSYPQGDVPGTHHELYGNLTDMSKLFPGDPKREVEGEECKEGSEAGGAPGDLAGKDTQVVAWNSFNPAVGQSVANALGSSASPKVFGPGDASAFEAEVAKAAADTSGKKYVFLFNCHGSPGSPGNWEGGLNTSSVQAKLKEGGNKDLSHITFVDGACFPCRAPYLAAQQQAEGITPINHVRSGFHQNRVQYYNPANGTSHTVSGFINAINQYKAGGAKRILQAQRSFGLREPPNQRPVLTREVLIAAARVWEREWREYQAAEAKQKVLKIVRKTNRRGTTL